MYTAFRDEDTQPKLNETVITNPKLSAGTKVGEPQPVKVTFYFPRVLLKQSDQVNRDQNWKMNPDPKIC